MSDPDDDTPPTRVAGPGSAEDGADGAAATEAGLAETQAALDELNARHLRLAADFENFRRRKTQELLDRGRYGAEALARSLLPVLDNLQRALDHAADAEPGSLLEGLRLVARQLEEALQAAGVERIPAEGEAFDPSVHEAVAGEESDAVDRDVVGDELQPGYRLHDRVLRPAMVRVLHPRSGDR